jgi:NADH dehydrogenase
MRDHLLGPMELADASDDLAERQARRTFVVVARGARYSGTEVSAQGQLSTSGGVASDKGVALLE